MTSTFESALARHSRPGPRYTSYPTAVQFHDGVGSADYIQYLHRANRVTEQPLSIYVHIPFCEQRCLFCACNTIISPHKEKVRSYLNELIDEIDVVASYIPHRRRVSQLHLGGGTPTYFGTDALRSVLKHIDSVFTFTHDAERSIEVDPRVTTDDHVEMLASMNFTRLSIGVQDLDPEVQRVVNRVQPFEMSAHVVQKARACGMRSVNVDLIYGLPKQSAESFAETVQSVIKLDPDRLAIYAFAYVPWLKGHQKQIPPDTIPDRDIRLVQQQIAKTLLLNAGYVDIGMDHYAKRGDSLAIAQREQRLHRNFMGYTTLEAPDMLGFGLSSVGYIGGAFFQNSKKLSTYRTALALGDLPVERGYMLDEDDQIRAWVIGELMCNFTLDKHIATTRFGVDFDTYFADELVRLAPDLEEGLVTSDEASLSVTDEGRAFVRSLAMAFDLYLLRAQVGEVAEPRPQFSQVV